MSRRTQLAEWRKRVGDARPRRRFPSPEAFDDAAAQTGLDASAIVDGVFPGDLSIQGAVSFLNEAGATVASINGLSGTYLLPTLTRTIALPGPLLLVDGGAVTTTGTSPDGPIYVLQLANGATQGVYSQFQMPADAVTGSITIRPVWVPSFNDAVEHTVRWSCNTQVLTPGLDITRAGTTDAWTGDSATHTANVCVQETGQPTTITPAAGSLVRLNLQRVGGHAADTLVADVYLFGILVQYTANQ